MPDPFASFTDADVRRMLAHYPFAWMYLPDRRDAPPIELPLIGAFDAAGGLLALIGHFGVRNPMHDGVRASPAARFLFRGPQAYVSPEHAGVRDWAPTWNYAHLVIDADVRVDEALTEPALAVLIDAMEAGRALPWTTGEMGARYRELAGRIIGFRAEVTAVSGRLKLGQDERPEVRDAILASHPDEDLKDWMRATDAARR